MKIDNSKAVAWQFCGLKYYERYVVGIEPRTRNGDALSFGTRFHQLLEERHKQGPGIYEPLADSILEAEARATFAAYEAFYPEEPFEVVSVEEYFEVPVGEEACWKMIRDSTTGVRTPCPDCKGTGLRFRHTYNGEFDAIVRMKDSGKLWLLETKTESRSSKANLPEAWISKSQVGLYLWAAEKIYEEVFEGICLNIITRSSPKGNCPPCFRRDSLHRTKAQQMDAIKNLVWVADQIEEMERTGFYPSNRNNCLSPNGWACDYKLLHDVPEGRPSEELVNIKFKKAEAYLSGL